MNTTERALVDLFHEALDGEDIAGPFQRLQLELDKSTGAAPRRRARRTLMTAQRLALLAAVLALVLVAGVVIGTRLVKPVAGFPAGHSSTYQQEVSQLLARPLTLPQIAAGATCPDGPYTGGLLGSGPVFGNGNGPTATSWGNYYDVFYDTPVDKGPIVVRGRDLVLGWPVVFLGQYAVGNPYGHDSLSGSTQTQFTAIAFDTDHSTASKVVLQDPPGTFVEWKLIQGIKRGGSGCIGFQIDGSAFTETMSAYDPSAL